MSWNLQALDPDTLAPPADPSVGFLPPNQHNPEGDGVVSFSVSPTNVPSGGEIANRASIEFDSNPLIETETWSNTIDREPPTASVQAEGTSDPASAHVSWSGSDDASGISLWEIKVSKDGGPYTVWRTAEANGSDTYTATESGTYSFRGVAHDGAGNVTESAQAAVTLTTGSEPTPNGSLAPTGGKDTPQAQKTAGNPGTGAVTASVNPARLVLLGQGSRFAVVLGSGNRLGLPIVAEVPDRRFKLPPEDNGVRHPWQRTQGDEARWWSGQPQARSHKLGTEQAACRTMEISAEAFKASDGKDQN